MRLVFTAFKYLIFGLGMLTLAALLLFWADRAAAHSWYDPYCCNTKDCSAALSAAPQADGSLMIEVAPGQSVKVPAGYPLRPSQDMDYHVCILFKQIRCVYAPANS